MLKGILDRRETLRGILDHRETLRGILDGREMLGESNIVENRVMS